MVSDKMEVDVLGVAVNSPVLGLPGRRFPGVLIQGDSLKIMAGLTSEIMATLAAGDLEEAKSVTEELYGQLRLSTLHLPRGPEVTRHRIAVSIRMVKDPAWALVACGFVSPAASLPSNGQPLLPLILTPRAQVDKKTRSRRFAAWRVQTSC